MTLTVPALAQEGEDDGALWDTTDHAAVHVMEQPMFRVGMAAAGGIDHAVDALRQQDRDRAMVQCKACTADSVGDQARVRVSARARDLSHATDQAHAGGSDCAFWRRLSHRFTWCDRQPI